MVDKSTVPVGTADRVRAAISEQLTKRGASLEFDVVSNPEFLKEGDAVKDCMRPDRIVIGAESQRSIERMWALYAPFNRNHDRLVVMDTRSAELTKYAANAMLATKISFMNEIANIAERVGADIEKVRHGIGSEAQHALGAFERRANDEALVLGFVATDGGGDMHNGGNALHGFGPAAIVEEIGLNQLKAL